MRPLHRSPEFLDHVRARLAEESVAEDEKVLGPFALLLAQYGDTTGLDVILEQWSRTQSDELVPPLLIALRVTKQEKFLPPLRKKIEAADSAHELRDLLKWLRGVRGAEPRKLRREINRRIRETGG